MNTPETMIHPFCLGTPVTLSEVLDAREQRAQMQQKLLGISSGSDNKLPASRSRTGLPVCLISFTLNIVGPVKVFPYTVLTYQTGLSLIEKYLEDEGIHIRRFEEIEQNTGYDAFFLAEVCPETCKKSLTSLEETHPLGRLFDIDVLRPDGSKVSREELRLPGRTCLLCHNPAFLCGRSRTHTARELLDREVSIMENYYIESVSARIGRLMKKALIMEVDTTLKPGLVDRVHNGSHQDMNHQTFLDSAYALESYFAETAKAGLRFGLKHSGKYPVAAPEIMPMLFSSIRPLGLNGEIVMKNASNGANTHKGIIFSGGILCCALGFCLATENTPRIPAFSQEDSRHIFDRLTEIIRFMLLHLKDDFKKLGDRKPESHGEILYVQYGITGIRGEASQGFPSLFSMGYPIFRELLCHGYSQNDAGLITLLHYIAKTEDTNIVIRSDYYTANAIREALNIYMEETDIKEQLSILPELDAYFVSKNISPGGSADMLALTYFLHLLFS